MPTAMKMTIAARTVSGTGFCSRKDVANRHEPSSGQNQSRRLNYIAVVLQPNATNPLMALHQTLRTPLIAVFIAFPRGSRQLSVRKSNHDFDASSPRFGTSNLWDQTKPVSPAKPASPINQSGFQRVQYAIAAVATVMTTASQL